MTRKLLAAILLAVAIVAVCGAFPGFMENIAQAQCDRNDPTCG